MQSVNRFVHVQVSEIEVGWLNGHLPLFVWSVQAWAWTRTRARVTNISVESIDNIPAVGLWDRGASNVQLQTRTGGLNNRNLILQIGFLELSEFPGEPHIRDTHFKVSATMYISELQ